MKKLSLGLAIMFAFTLTGCELYFGNHGDDYGDDTGQPPGWDCQSNADCAAGCYCEKTPGAGTSDSGTCSEQGFCDTDTDCPDGYVCDDRSSCVPNPAPTCPGGQDAECAAGSFCDNGLCEPSCVCANDAEAQAAGWAHCDEVRMTCKPENAGGTCGGAATCGTEPGCTEGSVALIGADGCYTGVCSAITTCDVTPECPAFQFESDCLNPSDDKSCGASYTGINCTKSDGSACQSGDTGCTCEGFVFAECRGPA